MVFPLGEATTALHEVWGLRDGEHQPEPLPAEAMPAAVALAGDQAGPAHAWPRRG